MDEQYASLEVEDEILSSPVNAIKSLTFQLGRDLDRPAERWISNYEIVELLSFNPTRNAATSCFYFRKFRYRLFELGFFVDDVLTYYWVELANFDFALLLPGSCSSN